MRAIKVYNYIPEKKLEGKRVIALGFFDGVHLGHREIIRNAVEEAKKLSIPSAVFTFSSESKGIKDESRIYSTENKLALIEELGIDEAIVADFGAVKNVSASDFVTDILLGELGCAIALSGEDFRFGKGAWGNTELLRELLAAKGAALICPDAVMQDGEKISSSRIKKLLTLGKVKKAAELLGAPYFVKSEVKRGLGLGKSFGFPTVNTEIKEGEISLISGVYKCKAYIDGKAYDALSNVGTCPTVSERKKHIETYVLGFSGDLYGDSITVNFLDFVRPEMKFESINQLIMQIKLDIINTFRSEDN